MFDLATYAKPPSRAKLLAAGDLVDCSASATWQGFTVPCAVSALCWDEVVGAPPLVLATRAERAAAAERLNRLWADAKAAVQRYRKRGVVQPSLAFRTTSAKGQPVPVRLVCVVERGQTAVTIHLEGES